MGRDLQLICFVFIDECHIIQQSSVEHAVKYQTSFDLIIVGRFIGLTLSEALSRLLL